MAEKQKTSLMLLVLYTLLIAALLILTVFGARLYAAAVQAQNRHGQDRSALAFLQSQLQSFEAGVSLKEGPEGTMLCLSEGDSGYETRIYLYDNALRTQLWDPSSPFLPEAGEKICGLSSLTLEWETPELLKITADGRFAYAHCPGGEKLG